MTACHTCNLSLRTDSEDTSVDPHHLPAGSKCFPFTCQCIVYLTVLHALVSIFFCVAVT